MRNESNTATCFSFDILPSLGSNMAFLAASYNLFMACTWRRSRPLTQKEHLGRRQSHLQEAILLVSS